VTSCRTRDSRDERRHLRCDLPGRRWSSGRADLVQQSFADIERGGAQLPRQGQQTQRQILYIAWNLAKIILALTEFLRSGAALGNGLFKHVVTALDRIRDRVCHHRFTTIARRRRGAGYTSPG